MLCIGVATGVIGGGPKGQVGVQELTAGGASSTMEAHLLVGTGTTLSSTSANAESALPPVVITAAATVMPCPRDIDMLAEVTSPLPVVSMASASIHSRYCEAYHRDLCPSIVNTITAVQRRCLCLVNSVAVLV